MPFSLFRIINDESVKNLETTDYAVVHVYVWIFEYMKALFKNH